LLYALRAVHQDANNKEDIGQLIDMYNYGNIY